MSAFSRLHPLVSLIYFVAVLSVGMFATNPVIEVLSLVGGILICSAVSGVNKKDFVFYFLLALLVMLTNPLFSHNGITPLFYLNGNPITLESVVYGCYMAVMVISVMLWFKVFSDVMTGDKLVYLFGRFLPQLSLVFSMALRYVPMLKRQAQKVSRAQKAMGLYASESLAERLRSGIRVISVLIGWSLENAVETAKSMKARGYGLRGHTNYSNYKFSKSDLTFMLILLMLAAVTASGMIFGKFEFYYYPQITEIPSGAYSVICYAAYGCLSLMPFILEAEEMIRWKYYRSKI